MPKKTENRSQQLSRSLSQTLQSAFGKGLLRGGHWIAASALKSAGYRFELRRSGDSKLGLWRKSFRKKGAKPARRFVLLPGWGDSPLSWLTVLGLLYRDLTRSYDEIVVFDFPGFHGFLSNERCFHDMGLLIQACHDALDSLKPHTLVGHSLGGWIASHYAGSCGNGSRPALKKKGSYSGPELLILADPSGVSGAPERTRELQETFLELVYGGFDAYRTALFAKDPFWITWLKPMADDFLRRDDVLQFLKSIKDEHLSEPLLANVTARVALIWGENDRLMPASLHQFWLQGLRPEVNHPVCALIADAAHNPHIEKPRVTAELIRRSLTNDFGARVMGQAISKRWRCVSV